MLDVKFLAFQGGEHISSQSTLCHSSFFSIKPELVFLYHSLYSWQAYRCVLLSTPFSYFLACTLAKPCYREDVYQSESKLCLHSISPCPQANAGRPPECIPDIADMTPPTNPIPPFLPGLKNAKSTWSIPRNYRILRKVD